MNIVSSDVTKLTPVEFGIERHLKIGMQMMVP